MDISYLIEHPETMSRETLYDLRSFLAIYPYYQPARLLMLKNLYILHDSSFDEELRRSAIYLIDKKVLFELVEAVHYRLKKESKLVSNQEEAIQDDNRTISLIDTFLESIPEEEVKEDKEKRRKPTPADAAIDYVSYLLEIENEEGRAKEKSATPQMKGKSLIDNFIYNEGGKIQLKDLPDFTPNTEEDPTTKEKDDDEGYFTETLAKIYIRQGRYNKALEIIQRLNLNYPKKNAYFADQIRFLEKLILNNKNNK